MTIRLETEAQVEQYLDRVLPSERRFYIGRMPVGAWLLQPRTTELELETGAAIGLPCLVVVPETGVVLQYPSWSGARVMDDYTEAIRGGGEPKARQIHPPRDQVVSTCLRQDETTIEYLIEATSHLRPPERIHLVIDKPTLRYSPTDTAATMAMAWALEHYGREGVWPVSGTIRY